MLRALRTTATALLTLLAVTLVAVHGLAQTSRPQKIVVSGRDLPEPVEITDPRDVDLLMVNLCTESDAGDTQDRPFYDIEIVWDPETTWKGEFYPAGGGGLAAAHILEWQLKLQGRAESQLCDERVVGRQALDTLGAYGITTDLATPRDPDRGLPPWVLPAAVAGVLMLIALVVWRLLPRSEGGEKDDLPDRGRIGQ